MQLKYPFIRVCREHVVGQTHNTKIADYSLEKWQSSAICQKTYIAPYNNHEGTERE
jgi:hypothetical protein